MNIRISIDGYGFLRLVSGQELEAGPVQIVLEDIGFRQMMEAITMAEAEQRAPASASAPSAEEAELRRFVASAKGTTVDLLQEMTGREREEVQQIWDDVVEEAITVALAEKRAPASASAPSVTLEEKQLMTLMIMGKVDVDGVRLSVNGHSRYMLHSLISTIHQALAASELDKE